MEQVRERLLRATAALESAGVPYAVTGGNAVAAWVARVDETAVRNTQDVCLLLRREDFDAARTALEAAGFAHPQVLGIDMFLDGPNGRPRDAVRIIFAGERVRTHSPVEAVDVAEAEPAAQFQVVNLNALVRMMLTSFRRKDQVHLLDLIDVDLVDATCLDRLPPVLAERLRELLDNPEG